MEYQIKRVDGDWMVKGLKYIDELDGEFNSDDTPIWPGMVNSLGSLLSMIKGIYSSLYDLYQVDENLKEGDRLVVSPTVIRGRWGRKGFRVPELSFYCESFHVYPSDETNDLWGRLEKEAGG